jgi:hypothetical protein
MLKPSRCPGGSQRRAMKFRWPWRKREKGWTCTRVQQYWDEYTEGQLSVQDEFKYGGPSGNM